MILKNNYKKFVAGFDIHGDKQDPTANKAFFKFCELWKPDIRVCGGDLYDFRPLRKKASEDDRRESLQADFDAGTDWLKKFQPNYFLLGNHDTRLWDVAETANGVVADYANQGIKEILDVGTKRKVEVLPYDRKTGELIIGHLKILHGIQHVSIEGLENRIGRMCGCLCQLDMDYVRANMGSLVWRHGWAYGVINIKTGDYQVWQAEQVNGNWILPTGLEMF